IALLELVERTEEARAHEVEDRPDLAQSILDRGNAEGEQAFGAQALGGAGGGAERVLDLLRFVDDDVPPVDLLKHLLVAAEERVARDDHVRVFELVLPLAALGAVPEGVSERWGEAVHLAEPVGDDACRRDNEHLERLALALDLRVFGFDRQEERQRLHGLAETHVVGQNAAAADLVKEPEPLEALLLVRPELGLEVTGLLRALDLVDVLELLEELFGVARDARAPDLRQQILDATRLREPLPTRAFAERASSRTCTSTRSSGTKMSQVSGSVAMPSVQKRIASSPRAMNLFPSSAGTSPRSRSLAAASCCAARPLRMHLARRDGALARSERPRGTTWLPGAPAAMALGADFTMT